MCNAILRNHIKELLQTKSSAIKTYANIPRVDRFCQFFVRLVSFILDRKRSIALSVTQSFSPSPPAWQFKTHYTANSCKYVVSRWSSGNRRRATSAREVIEVAGSNHAIGVILNLAWGPNNFSPSMIWNWRTRSNSRTGLGAEELLPAKLYFSFCWFFFYFFSLLVFFFRQLC